MQTIHRLTVTGPHSDQPVIAAGTELGKASAVVIMLHGRGATAESILVLAGGLSRPQTAYLAPQATINTWYPQSFLMPLEQNEPWLSSALAAVGETLRLAVDASIPEERVYLIGFSQGACLASEYVARNARRYGGLAALSGGLIGPDGTPRDYPGTLDNTPVFLGCSDVDFHIPKERVIDSADVFRRLGADVTMKLYPGMGHTVNEDEVAEVRRMVEMVGSQEN